LICESTSATRLYACASMQTCAVLHAVTWLFAC
jgi:hypothetical protein